MTDIRVGDLVKATSKNRPQEYAVFRVTEVGPYFIYGETRIENLDGSTFEVLDRPLPPIDEELIFAAVDAFRDAQGFSTPARPTTQEHVQSAAYRKPAVAIINAVREYDRKNATKENA